jgi:two-component system nitrogen regulation response regulator GlnG
MLVVPEFERLAVEAKLAPQEKMSPAGRAMRATAGNQVRAAKLLGITRATLRKRMEIFGITKELNING